MPGHFFFFLEQLDIFRPLTFELFEKADSGYLLIHNRTGIGLLSILE